MRTADLTDALLDYWTARAEGVPADELEIRPVQRPDPRTPDTICVRRMFYRNGEPCAVIRIDYSTNWALTGPLIEKHGIAPVPFATDEFDFEPSEAGAIGTVLPTLWGAFIEGEGGPYIETYLSQADGRGKTPLIAICRAVVRAAFGDEVPDA